MSASITRWLQADARSGILFNLGASISMGGDFFPSGVILTPVSKSAHSITLPANAQIAGIRFYAGVGFDIFQRHYQRPMLLDGDNEHGELQKIHARLRKLDNNTARISALYRFLCSENNIFSIQATKTKTHLHRSLEPVPHQNSMASFSLSQRQIERTFQKRLDMTPKHYQRIMRVRKTLDSLKAKPESDLVSLALDHGFSDQAHMNREFREIAGISPKRFGKLIKQRITLNTTPTN
ncbi:MAG: helix-turn-helix domain-containing protein [Gammaproteobacteria bacterium]|nr:helix-turn-helix domain-containing protein [Gammaproteobacteria bacterium]